MRSMRTVLLFALFVPIAYAKVKPRITIQVTGSETSERHWTQYVPGQNGTSHTNCNTRGPSYETATAYGNTVNSNASGYSNTSCSTTTSAATPARTVEHSITQEQVGAVLPDGRVAVLWCQNGFRKCEYLQPGKYDAEIDGNTMFVFVPDLSGKERKIKYKAVSVGPAPSQP